MVAQPTAPVAVSDGAGSSLTASQVWVRCPVSRSTGAPRRPSSRVRHREGERHHVLLAFGIGLCRFPSPLRPVDIAQRPLPPAVQTPLPRYTNRPGRSISAVST